MASLLCVKTPSGVVRVHNKTKDGLLPFSDDDDASKTKFMPRAGDRKSSPSQRPVSCPVVSNSCFSLDSTPFLKHLADKETSWLGKKNIEELQGLSPKDPVSQRMCSSLLETEQTLVKDVTDYLDHKDMLDLRKRELLHKNWNSRVYEPIRHEIINAMNSGDWPEKDRRRRELHRQYLEHVNKKGHVFLDTMDEGEYYAQALNQHRPASIQVHTERLHDPLLAQERDRNTEDQVILRCQTGHLYSHADVDQVRLPPLPLVPLGRHGTDSVGWLDMPLGNVESTPRKASRLRMRGACTDTQIDFPKWSKLQFDARVLDQEMQLQKKRMFEEKPPFGIPARQFAKAPFATKSPGGEQSTVCAVNT